MKNDRERTSGGLPTLPQEALADAAARMGAVAQVHKLLAPNGGERGTVKLDDFLHGLANHFVDGAESPSQVVLLVNADPIQVPVRIAGMLGQIVNELVNVIRHAVDPERPGAIRIECGTDADGAIVLQVNDDGQSFIDGSVRVRFGADA